MPLPQGQWADIQQNPALQAHLAYDIYDLELEVHDRLAQFNAEQTAVYNAVMDLHRDLPNYLPPCTLRVTVPIITTGQKCPVTPDNTVEWKEAERIVASRATVMQSVPELVSNR